MENNESRLVTSAGNIIEVIATSKIKVKDPERKTETITEVKVLDDEKQWKT